MIKLYISGTAAGNPAPGAWTTHLYDERSHSKQEFTGTHPSTTKSRMELTALLTGLQSIQDPKASISIYSSSSYILDALRSGSAKQWRENDWIKENGFEVPNPDLWSEILTKIDTFQTTPSYIQISDPSLPAPQPFESVSEEKGREYLITMRVKTKSDQLLTTLPAAEKQTYCLDTLLVTSIQNNDLNAALQAHGTMLLSTAQLPIKRDLKGENQ